MHGLQHALHVSRKQERRPPVFLSSLAKLDLSRTSWHVLKCLYGHQGFYSYGSLRSWRYGACEIKIFQRSQSLSPSRLFSSQLRRSLVGSAAKTLFPVRLQYRQLRRL